jgi:hypothetical protein
MIARHFAFLISASVTTAACTVGETTYLTVEQPSRAVSEVKTCSGAFVKPELSKLIACGNDKGHCYDGAKTAIANLPTCDGGGDSCIPDKVLVANGGKLKSCTFFVGGKPGACMSTLIEDIDAHKGELQKDVCDEDERCAPCIDPRDGSDTHICDPIGVYQDACKGGPGTQLASCCHHQGVCISPEAAPADQRDSMVPDICPRSKVCAPASLVDGKPKQCNVLGDPGVCIDVCFSKMLGPIQKVFRDKCSPTEVCLPCLIGAGQGVPGC